MCDCSNDICSDSQPKDNAQDLKYISQMMLLNHLYKKGYIDMLSQELEDIFPNLQILINYKK